MGNTIKSSWNFSTAMGELTSSFVIAFAIMVIVALTKYKNSKDGIKISGVVQSALYAIAGLTAMFMGQAVGNLLSANGSIPGDAGMGLTTPMFAILVSFHFGVFTSLPMIIGFQAIGALLGVGLYVAFAFAFKAQHKSFDWTSGLIINNKEPKRVAPMEAIAQLVVAGTMMILSSSLENVIGVDNVSIKFILILALFLVLVLFSSTGFFILSPFIELYSLVIGLFIKKSTKTAWINFGIQTTIHISMALAIGGIEYQIRYS